MTPHKQAAGHDPRQSTPDVHAGSLASALFRPSRSLPQGPTNTCPLCSSPSRSPFCCSPLLLHVCRRGGEAAGQAAQRCVAQCVAVLVVAQGQAQVAASVKELLGMLKKGDAGEPGLEVAGFSGRRFGMVFRV